MIVYFMELLICRFTLEGLPYIWYWLHDFVDECTLARHGGAKEACLKDNKNAHAILGM